MSEYLIVLILWILNTATDQLLTVTVTSVIVRALKKSLLGHTTPCSCTAVCYFLYARMHQELNCIF